MSTTLLLLGQGPGWVGFTFGLLVAAAAGAGGVWLLIQYRLKRDFEQQRREADAVLGQARAERDELLKSAEVEAHKKLLDTMQRFEAETAEARKELKEFERRLNKRDDNLDKKLDVLHTKERKIEEEQARLAKQRDQLDDQLEEAKRLREEQRTELLGISKLTESEAHAQCLKRLSEEVEREAGELVEKIIGNATENARQRARHITIEAIQRYAAEHTSETTVSTIDVASDEMKGRIIGREGRNIRAFEKVTGVTVIVDDTPGVVSISCFDPVRREVARIALDRLVRDGRIHPTRIEEMIAEINAEMDEKLVEYGNQAVHDTNLHGVHKKIIPMLGRLHYRTSYGQNVLQHSIEVAHLCGIMADELGLDAALARRCGLLHDIGKALDHELEGTHTKIGADFCKKFNEPAAVLNAVAGHHGDIEATHPYTPLVTAADAMSAARPGGRRESLERYIKRLEELESIASQREGVNQAYAVEAGREVRVIVDAEMVADRSALKLARDIAKEIEESMTYPGEIKVTVLREIRAVEYAR